MPITSLNDLHKLHDSLQASNLPLVIHGPMTADITLICHGKITPEVVEAAQFLDNQYPSINVNVVQIKQLDPLPVAELQAIFQSMKYLLLIESDVEQDLYQLIIKQVGVSLDHRRYFNPGQPQLAAKIIALVKSTFLIAK